MTFAIDMRTDLLCLYVIVPVVVTNRKVIERLFLLIPPTDLVRNRTESQRSNVDHVVIISPNPPAAISLFRSVEGGDYGYE